MKGPRIPPVLDDEMSQVQRDTLKPFVQPDGRLDNVFRTMGRYPDALRRWTPFIGHVLRRSSLSLRETELLILRVAAAREAGYAWTQHVRIARGAGFSDGEILAVREGPSAARWNETERALLQAADDLLGSAQISDAAWTVLAGRYAVPQLIDVILTVGQYNLVAMVLKTCGVETDEAFADDPPLQDT